MPDRLEAQLIETTSAVTRLRRERAGLIVVVLLMLASLILVAYVAFDHNAGPQVGVLQQSSLNSGRAGSSSRPSRCSSPARKRTPP